MQRSALKIGRVASAVAPLPRQPVVQKRCYTLFSTRLSGGTTATVFGSSGNLARYIVNRLGRLGAQVAVPYRGDEKVINHLKVLGDVGQIVPLKFDVRDPARIALAVSKSNVVVNCLGRFWPTRNFTLTQANVDSARLIAQAAKDAGITKFIQLSCVGAAPDHPSEYMRAKWEAEQVVKSIIPTATIVRSTQMFGYEDRILNRWGTMCRFSGFIPLPLRADAYIQPVAATDVAAAVFELIQAPVDLPDHKFLETRGARATHLLDIQPEPTEHPLATHGVPTPLHGKTYELGGPMIYTVRDFMDDVIFAGTRTETPYLIKIPKVLAMPTAQFFEQFRSVLYYRDEVKMYERDNIVPDGALGFPELGLPAPMSIDRMADTVLRAHRKPFRFTVE